MKNFPTDKTDFQLLLELAKRQQDQNNLLETALLIHRESENNLMRNKALQTALKTELNLIKENEKSNVRVRSCVVIEKYYNLARSNERIHIMPFTLQQIVRSPSYNNLFQILQNHKKELIHKL